MAQVQQHVNKEQLDEYYKALSESPDAAARVLSSILALPDYTFIARSAIQVDYASSVLEFAKDMGFGPMRTATLFSVAQNLLQVAMAGASMADAQATLTSALLQLTSPKPGVDSQLMSPDQVAKSGAFFARTFLRHYRLYAYAFTHEQELTEYTAQLMVETALIPSFDGAMSEEEWAAYNNDIKAKEEAAKLAAEQAEAARVAAEAAAAAEKAAAEAEAKRQEELAKKPATLEEAVAHAVALRLEEERKALQSEYASKEAVLMKKIEDLEGKAAAPAAAAAQPAAPAPAPAAAGKK